MRDNTVRKFYDFVPHDGGGLLSLGGERMYTRDQVIGAYEQGTKDGRFHTSNETDEAYVRRNAEEYVDGLQSFDVT